MNAIYAPGSPNTGNKTTGTPSRSEKGFFKTMGLVVWRFLEEVGHRRAARIMASGHYYY
ncbi:MAG: hypothetical protein JWR60_1503 [Polaromonas sp.]|nr:hypothetical protein [Polaromonas sp.]